MSAEHRLKALDALNLIPMADNPAAEMASASEATAHALLYVGDQLAQLVEQQKLANVIASYNSGALGNWEFAHIHIGARIDEIVNTASRSEAGQ